MANPLPRGCGVALVTPFQSDGRLDESALERMVEHVVDGGVDFVVVLGTTGEAVSQSRAECLHVMRRVHDLVAGRVPLVAGPFGGNGTTAVLERIKGYADVLALPGYVAVMSSVPSYVKPNQEGIFQHFVEVAKASPLPILLYDVPGRTGKHMTPATTLRLARASEKFIGIKDATGDLAVGMRLIRDTPRDFRVYSGDDPTALPFIASGGDGVVSVVANAFPREFTGVAHAAIDGKLREARRLNDPLIDLHAPLYVDGNPAGVKAVLQQLGLCGETLRLPLTPVSEATREALVRELLQVAAANAPGIA